MRKEVVEGRVGWGVGQWRAGQCDDVMLLFSFRRYPVPTPSVCRLSSCLGGSQVCNVNWETLWHKYLGRGVLMHGHLNSTARALFLLNVYW